MLISSIQFLALSATGLTLKPSSLTPTHLSGRMLPKSGVDLERTGTLFSQFLNGQNVTLQTTGQSVQPPGSSGTVGWLSTAFKSLTLDVILPGEKLQVYHINFLIFIDSQRHSRL
jgi:hypothetical protein